MINSIKILIVWGLFFTTTLLSAYPTAKVTARVIDDEGKPLEGIEVSCRFELPKVGGLGVKSTIKEGLTDQNGLFTAKGSTSSGFASCGAKDKDYYRGGAGTGRFTGVSGIYGFRKWQPWNPTIDVVLKRIINPIPLYVVELTGKGILHESPVILPEEGKFFGFDLIAKDWVVPYGQGLHSDFIFKIDVDYYSPEPYEYDNTMTLKFTNPDDGIQSFYTPENRGSDLRSAHHAPLTGYKKELKTRKTRKKDRVLKSAYRDDQNYYFRIRTKRDEQGNIIEAYYGKIYGNIKFISPRKNKRKGEFYFSYYLNPNSNDTNVENAPEKNLFPKPKGHTGWYRFKP